MSDTVENETTETTEAPDESVVIDYSKVDFSDVDEEGNIRNFKEAIVDPKKKETVETEETNENNVPDNQESLEDSSVVEEISDDKENDFSMENFGDIEKQMEFLNQGFDDKPDIPKGKQAETEKGTQQTDQIDKSTQVPEVTEKEIPYSQKFKNNLAPVNAVYEAILARHGVSWEAAKADIESHFDNVAFREELTYNNEREREELKREREELKREKKVEASRPACTQNLAEVSREKGWKNSQQLHDYMYSDKGGGELMLFLFNFKNENAKYLSPDELKQKWDDFNIEFGSNKKNLEFAEKQMRKFHIANNYMKTVSKTVAKKLKQQAQQKKGLTLNSKTNKSITTKTASKLSKDQRYFYG